MSSRGRGGSSSVGKGWLVWSKSRIKLLLTCAGEASALASAVGKGYFRARILLQQQVQPLMITKNCWR